MIDNRKAIREDMLTDITKSCHHEEIGFAKFKQIVEQNEQPEIGRSDLKGVDFLKNSTSTQLESSIVSTASTASRRRKHSETGINEITTCSIGLSPNPMTCRVEGQKKAKFENRRYPEEQKNKPKTSEYQEHVFFKEFYSVFLKNRSEERAQDRKERLEQEKRLDEIQGISTNVPPNQI